MKLHHLALTVILATAAFAFGYGIANAEEGTFTCQPARVVDGDTILCADGLRIRLWGISAPERRDPEGPASTEALREIIGTSELHCTVKGANGNRIVALCQPLGEDIAAQMVRRGQAKDWERYSGGYYGR
jgi:endonuclease YncB( thermonuclease family)